jgi:hypothetical protein
MRIQPDASETLQEERKPKAGSHARVYRVMRIFDGSEARKSHIAHPRFFRWNRRTTTSKSDLADEKSAKTADDDAEVNDTRAGPARKRNKVTRRGDQTCEREAEPQERRWETHACASLAKSRRPYVRVAERREERRMPRRMTRNGQRTD